MTEEELRKRVDAIIAKSYDDERAHSMEDDLYVFLIYLFCPDWVKAEIKRLNAANFSRWCG